jgi:hypothetical protein
MPRCCPSASSYVRPTETSRFLRVAKMKYVFAPIPSISVRSVTRRITQGFNLRPLTIGDFVDPDDASTTVDSEPDRVENVEPLD